MKLAKANFQSAFRYTDQEAELLMQHPTIKRKMNQWGEYLSPEYLVELKIKQRQKGTLWLYYAIEYWKHRVRADFQPASETLKKLQILKTEKYLQYNK